MKRNNCFIPSKTSWIEAVKDEHCRHRDRDEDERGRDRILLGRSNAADTVTAGATATEPRPESDEQSSDRNYPESAHRPKERSAIPKEKAQGRAADQTSEKHQSPRLVSVNICPSGSDWDEKPAKNSRDPRNFPAQDSRNQAGEPDQASTQQRMQIGVLVHILLSTLAFLLSTFPLLENYFRNRSSARA
jgi:hypothetical protein